MSLPPNNTSEFPETADVDPIGVSGGMDVGPSADALVTGEGGGAAAGDDDILQGVELLTEAAAPTGARPDEASDAHAHAAAAPKVDFDLPQWMGALEIMAPTKIPQNISRSKYTW